jgi:hypothetical protein
VTSDYIDRLLELDFGQLALMISGVLRDPSSNFTVFVLFLAAVTIVLLLVIVALVLVFTGGDEEYEEYEEYGDYVETDEEAEARLAAVAERAAEAKAKAERRRRLAPVMALAWLGIAAVVWMAGGYVSGRDAICVSCHEDGSLLHTTRYTEPEADPHSGTRCIACHETSNWLAGVTVAVPGRAAHYINGVLTDADTSGYGVPVANNSCAGCHRRSLGETIESEDRGLRMSHAEPLESKALCSDCHAMHPGSGVVDRYTVGMDPCMRCHDQQTASAECSYCHTKDIGYALRSRTFLEPKIQVVDISCGGCHDEGPCDACHGTRMPHTAEFKGAFHAREAVEDIWDNGGRTCRRCHTNTRRSCTQCHKGTFPTHPPGYMPKGHQNADPLNNGCDQCHWQNAWIRGRNFCGLCHEQWRGLDPGRRTNQ